MPRIIGHGFDIQFNGYIWRAHLLVTYDIKVHLMAACDISVHLLEAYDINVHYLLFNKLQPWHNFNPAVFPREILKISYKV